MKRNGVIMTLVYAVLFSVLGCLSYYLIIHFSEISSRAPESMTALGALGSTIVVFNVFGFCLLKINEWLAGTSATFYINRAKLLFFYIFIAAILLILNVSLFFILKIAANSPDPFTIRASGIRLIIVLWMVEMLIFSLILLNHTSMTVLRFYKEKEKLQENVFRMQYMALQSQLKPHFLFNSLNTLISEIEYDPESAVLFTQNLSDVYRYILQQQDKMLVNLEEEKEFLDSYIFLMNVRLGKCVDITYDIKEADREAMVPPLSLQLLAENVIKHNIVDERHPADIIITTDGKFLHFSNRLYPKSGSSDTGTGLRNLKERYRLLNAGKVEIHNDHIRFTVSLPLVHEF